MRKKCGKSFNRFCETLSVHFLESTPALLLESVETLRGLPVSRQRCGGRGGEGALCQSVDDCKSIYYKCVDCKSIYYKCVDEKVISGISYKSLRLPFGRKKKRTNFVRTSSVRPRFVRFVRFVRGRSASSGPQLAVVPHGLNDLP
uniref:Uncharacterized protein n=1 Tax=Caenorhabditis japonica TaxID=281687 RepID=A0A8R1ES33_CAEJA